MATYKSTQLSALAGPPQSLADVREFFGKLRLVRGTYVTAGTETVNQTVELCRLTNAQAVVGWLSRVKTTEALGSDVQIDIGYEAYTQEDGTSVTADPDYFTATPKDATAAIDGALDTVLWKSDVRAKDGSVSITAAFIIKTSALSVTASKTLDVFLVIVQE